MALIMGYKRRLYIAQISAKQRHGGKGIVVNASWANVVYTNNDKKKQNKLNKLIHF